MKHIFHTIFALSLIACGGSSSDDPKDNGMKIWTESSQRLVITKDEGNTANPSSWHRVYDFSLDSLTTEKKEKLHTVRTTSSLLTCSEDDITYALTVTDGTGVESSYLSSNKACNNINGLYFVNINDITSLITKLSEGFIFADANE